MLLFGIISDRLKGDCENSENITTATISCFTVYIHVLFCERFFYKAIRIKHVNVLFLFFIKSLKYTCSKKVCKE